MRINTINNIKYINQNKYDINPKSSLPESVSTTQKSELILPDTNKYLISFGRNIEEHTSWGATFNPDNSVNFKLFTYPDTRDVYVEISPQDSKDTNDIHTRGLKVKRNDYDIVQDILPTDRHSQMFKLENVGKGVFQAKNLPDIKDGSFYRFIIIKKHGGIQISKDPYAKKQPSVQGWSQIYDNRKFNWSDDNWMNGQDPRRISRQKDKGLKSINSLRIYELNIPTISQAGDFEGAKAQLRKIKAQNLANTIEIMPVENTFSKQWGYDGVDKFAVNDKLGGADGLKDFINYAHSIGINVIMDMVPNHIGPDGDMLSKTGPYRRGSGNFGAEFNFEGKDNRYVRDFVANMALNWAKEYHVDGLRLDMTNPGVMGSDLTLKQIVAEVNKHCSDVFMIAEDASNNRTKITTPIKSTGNHQRDIEEIDRRIHAIEMNGAAAIGDISDIGFDSEWNFPLMHSIQSLTDAPYSTNIEDFDKLIKNSKHRIAYSTSHDEIGNYDGTSATVKYATSYLKLYDSIKGNNKSEKYQKAAHATQKLLTLYATDALESMSNEEFSQTIKSLEITKPISKQDIENAYKYALTKMKLALGTVYSIPGPKMYFQGSENAGLDYFKFFREFSEAQEDDEAIRKRVLEQKITMDREKGYDTDYTTAHKDSIIGNIKCSPRIQGVMNNISLYTTDLNNLVEVHRALQDGNIATTQVFKNEKVHCVHSKSGEDEIFAIKNYSAKSYPEFGIIFPKGQWKEVINSNDAKYSGNNQFVNKDLIISSDGYQHSPIQLGADTVSIFERIR